MNRWVCVALLATGCAFFQKTKETVEGALEPIVAVGLVVQVDPFEDPVLDEFELDLEIGRSGTVFLADARDVSDLENSPVDGATLEASGCGQKVRMNEAETGTYVLSVGSALDACAADEIVVTRTDVDPGTVLPFTLPSAPAFDVPRNHTAGQPITLPLTASGYESALVVVIDGSTGDVTFSNEPEGIVETYQFIKGTGTVEDVTIPGEAFREDTVHAVIVTGLISTPNVDLTEANTVLSTVAGGRARVYAVSTIPPE
ncbi:MAG TPA: hypothetical protein PKA64_19015 [Myxococcota bacterium]|nr:hypothetical protein [Myxococcota bacterium]